MKIISIFPFSACGSCQTIFTELLTTQTNHVILDIEQKTADIILIPSMIKQHHFEYLLASIDQIPYPRKIIAVGDNHQDLGIGHIYTPEKLPVFRVIQGCPVDIKNLEQTISP